MSSNEPATNSLPRMSAQTVKRRGEPPVRPSIVGDQFVSVQAFCMTYSLSKATAYRLIARNEIEALKIGTATRISRASIERWHASLEPLISSSRG